MSNIRSSTALIGICAVTLIMSFFYLAAPTIKYQCRNDLRNIVSTNMANRTPKTIPNTTPYSWDKAAMRFHIRKDYLRNICRKRKLFVNERWVPNYNFLVDLHHNLLICAVPKTGSTTWHRTIWALKRIREGLDTDQKLYTAKDTVINQQKILTLSSAQGYSLVKHVHGDDDLWQNPPPGSSFRVILVRHPFARLISGWNQKFMMKSNYWVYLFKTYKTLLDYKKHFDVNHTMTFGDFAEYLVNNGNSALDFHFKPASRMCLPCYYDYTYVVKAESVDDDEPWLLHRLNLTNLNVGRRGVPPGGSVVNGDLVANIKKYITELSPNTVKRLYALYQSDFELFGYTFNFTTLEAGGFE